MDNHHTKIVKYSLADFLNHKMQGFMVELGEITNEGCTTFYQFFLRNDSTLYQLKKRFDEFRVLREQMVEELQIIDPSERPITPSYHVVPTLPDLGIDHVSQD
jgi:hypothetical protein